MSVTGFYTFVKYADDQGMLFMNLNGTRTREEMELLVHHKNYKGGTPWHGPTHIDTVSRKLRLEGGVPYPFEDMYLEWGGGDWSTLGYIFHGQDEFYNLEHEPVSKKV